MTSSQALEYLVGDNTPKAIAKLGIGATLATGSILGILSNTDSPLKMLLYGGLGAVAALTFRSSMADLNAQHIIFQYNHLRLHHSKLHLRVQPIDKETDFNKDCGFYFINNITPEYMTEFIPPQDPKSHLYSYQTVFDIPPLQAEYFTATRPEIPSPLHAIIRRSDSRIVQLGPAITP